MSEVVFTRMFCQKCSAQNFRRRLHRSPHVRRGTLCGTAPPDDSVYGVGAISERRAPRFTVVVRVD